MHVLWVKAPKSSLVTPILRSLHWLRINERIEYKLLSLTYKVLTTSQPDYLHNMISVQSSGRTRSSSVVNLARPSDSVSSSLQITNRSFRLCITSPVESTPFFIPSTSLCSLSSWFTPSWAYHLITVITFILTVCHSLHLSLQTQNSSLSQILSSIVTLIPSGLPSRILTCTELKGHCFVLVSGYVC